MTAPPGGLPPVTMLSEAARRRLGRPSLCHCGESFGYPAGWDELYAAVKAHLDATMDHGNDPERTP